jgi:hypothetical protein
MSPEEKAAAAAQYATSIITALWYNPCRSKEMADYINRLLVPYGYMVSPLLGADLADQDLRRAYCAYLEATKEKPPAREAPGG